MLFFTTNALKELLRYAANEYPTECCGILIGQKYDAEKTVMIAYPVRNMTAEDKCNSFYIDPLDIMRAEIYAEQKGLEILGFFHSHPDNEAKASTEDIQHMITGLFYPIISVKNGKAAELRCYVKADNGAIRKELIKRRDENEDFSLYCRNTAGICK